jgi:hypothetical protein
MISGEACPDHFTGGNGGNGARAEVAGSELTTPQSDSCSPHRKTRFAPDGKKPSGAVAGVADPGPASPWPATTQALFPRSCRSEFTRDSIAESPASRLLHLLRHARLFWATRPCGLWSCLSETGRLSGWRSGPVSRVLTQRSSPGRKGASPNTQDGFSPVPGRSAPPRHP